MTEKKEKVDDFFAGRWSRLKTDARQRRLTAGESTAEEGASSGSTTDLVQESEVQEDLTGLPCIEQIDADTDLTPWLAKKVPEAWRTAALRKMWTSDVAIAQFTGPADYDWDWNTPESVPGFGPLRLVDVVRLTHQAFAEPPSVQDESEKPVSAAGASRVEAASPSTGQTTPTAEVTPTPIVDHFSQRSSRRSGGALPE